MGPELVGVRDAKGVACYESESLNSHFTSYIPPVLIISILNDFPEFLGISSGQALASQSPSWLKNPRACASRTCSELFAIHAGASNITSDEDTLFTASMPNILHTYGEANQGCSLLREPRSRYIFKSLPFHSFFVSIVSGPRS